MLGLVGVAVGGVCSVVAAVRAARRRQWKWWLLGSTVGAFLVWRAAWAHDLLMLVVVFLVFAFPVIAIAIAAYRPDEDAADAIERSDLERSDERRRGTLLAVLALVLVPAAAVIYAPGARSLVATWVSTTRAGRRSTSGQSCSSPQLSL